MLGGRAPLVRLGGNICRRHRRCRIKGYHYNHSSFVNYSSKSYDSVSDPSSPPLKTPKKSLKSNINIDTNTSTNESFIPITPKSSSSPRLTKKSSLNPDKIPSSSSSSTSTPTKLLRIKTPTTNPDHSTPLLLKNPPPSSSPSSDTTQSLAPSTVFVSDYFSLPENEVVQYVTRRKLLHKTTSTHVILRECPTCPDHKGKADNLYKLHILKEGGVFKCHRCSQSGSWYKLKNLLGGNSIPTVVQPISSSNSSTPGPLGKKIVSHKTWQEKAKSYPSNLFLAEYNSVLQYLMKERGLKKQTLEFYKVGAAKYSFLQDSDDWEENEQHQQHQQQSYQPKWNEQLCVTFPWISRDGKNLIKVKVRSISNKKNQRIDPKSTIKPPSSASLSTRDGVVDETNWGFFGYHTIPADAKEIIITEGEFDAMAVYQATGRATISLPNGASSLPVQVLPLLERFSKIYLWMDNDKAGMDGAAKFAKKLGVKRTFIVSTLASLTQQLVDDQNLNDNVTATDQNLNVKDANDALKLGLNFNNFLDAAQRLPNNQILTWRDLQEDVLQQFHTSSILNNPNSPYAKNNENNNNNNNAKNLILSKSFPTLSTMTKGFRRGEFTILSGPTGVGKTTFLSQLTLDYCKEGISTLWGSFETKNSVLAKRMMTQFVSRPASEISPKSPIDANDIDEHIIEYWNEYSHQFSELPLYFMSFFGSSPLELILDAMDYSTYVYDVEHIVLDNLQFMLSGQTATGSHGNSFGGSGGGYFSKFDYQDKAIESFRAFASSKNVHVTLVIHPRKEDDDVPLNTASIFGTAKATQEADNVMIIQRGKERKYIDVRKNRYEGDIGSIPIRFEKKQLRFYEDWGGVRRKTGVEENGGGNEVEGRKKVVGVERKSRGRGKREKEEESFES
eukprot:TRINITY_DN1034_c2_g1_i1.p1 TRINITY_DN1034_c2_g1~~TRINITY_DN1034_c2_g1_i1.p1  ORF type:complete len:899 (-),score=259.30 TRINITY_DN1034_c2_g1_i1:44-2740(-)